MPKNAKVFLIESNDMIREMATAALEADGHKVVLTAGNFEEARANIKLVEEKKVNIVVLDGYLGGANANYAQEIVGLLRKPDSEIKIVVFSWDRVGADWGDAYVDKGTDPGHVGKAVTEL